MSDFWLDWDGRRLAWNGEIVKSQCDEVELCVDDVVFERLTVVAARTERDFPVSPSGNDEMEFSLRSTKGTVICARWRVIHGRAATAGTNQWEGTARPMRALPVSSLSASVQTRDIAIVVPIYNSPALVQRCIESVLRWTQGKARLILLNDASTDPGIAKLLAEYKHRDGVTIHHNPSNLGYTRTTNLGIEIAGNADVVFLNSDTEVGPRWLESLRFIAYSKENIGTVTAVSDNAGAFSVPELEKFCPIPSHWTLPMAQRALLQNMNGCLAELPTGNGFCMFVKRAMLDRAGVLDADAFPSGYGEENDLCQRAEQAGFSHLIAGSILVRHARSASFGDERRAALGVQGMAVLRTRYPDYEAKVGAALHSFERRMLDYRVRRMYADRDGMYAAMPPRPRVLVTTQIPILAGALNSNYELCFFHSDDNGVLKLTRHTENAQSITETYSDVIDMLARNAIELMHICTETHPALRRAATALGIAIADSSGDEEFQSLFRSAREDRSESNVEELTVYCMKLYDRCTQEGASFGNSGNNQ
jgi:GT2 family glycosyltransferase